MKTHKPLVDCYFIAHDPSVHYGELKVGQEVATGQANLEIFENEQEYLNRLSEFGIVLNDQQEIEV